MKTQNKKTSQKKVSLSDAVNLITKSIETIKNKLCKKSNGKDAEIISNDALVDDSDYDDYISYQESQRSNDVIANSADENYDVVATVNSKKNRSSTKLEEKNSSSSQSQARPETNFFYTSDKFINAFEDDEIIKYIQQKYTMFKDVDVDDTMMRKTIIDMLNDSKFMVKLLKYYNMTIFDFIKFLFRQEPSLFKGQFVKRISKSLKYKKYVSQDKKQAFRYSPKRKGKVRRKRS